MKLCADLRLSLGIIGLFICITMSYNIPDDDLVLTDDTLSRKTNGDRMVKLNADDNNRLAARKRSFWTDYKSSSLDTPIFGDLRTLPEPQNSRAVKQGPQLSLSDKRAYMHDPFIKMSEQLETVANTLSILSGDVQAMKSEFAAKLNDWKTISEKQKANAVTLDALTEAMAMMKSEFMRKLDKIETNMNDQFKTVSETLKANSEKLDYVEWRALYPSCLGYRNAGYMKNGKYRITIPYTKHVLTAYCDQNTDGGGWLVFQRRQDGSVDFYRDWNDYKAGFGDVSGEFWLGNDHIHYLTRDQQELRVDLLDFYGNTAYAKYASFSVGSESENYTLSVSGFSGIAKDSLQYHSGSKFSTKDRGYGGGSCARACKGGWWYNECSYLSNLNGLYYHSADRNIYGIRWISWKTESLKKTELKIRPK